MNTTPINQPISVVTYADHQTSKPYGFIWNNRHYKIHQHGYHYTVHQGQDLLHIFTGSTHTLAFKIAFNTRYLTWQLLELSETGPFK